MASVATRVRDKNEWKILQASLSSVWTLSETVGAGAPVDTACTAFAAFAASFASYAYRECQCA